MSRMPCSKNWSPKTGERGPVDGLFSSSVEWLVIESRNLALQQHYHLAAKLPPTLRLFMKADVASTVGTEMGKPYRCANRNHNESELL